MSPNPVWPVRSRAVGQRRRWRRRAAPRPRRRSTTGVAPAAAMRGRQRAVVARSASASPSRCAAPPGTRTTKPLGRAKRAMSVAAQVRSGGGISAMPARRSWSAWRSIVCMRSRAGLSCGCEAPRGDAAPFRTLRPAASGGNRCSTGRWSGDRRRGRSRLRAGAGASAIEAARHRKSRGRSSTQTSSK